MAGFKRSMTGPAAMQSCGPSPMGPERQSERPQAHGIVDFRDITV